MPKIIILTLVASVFFISCSKSDRTEQQTDKKQTTEESKMISKSDTVAMESAKYVCPMHPLERSNEPGKCPICKMKLVSMADLNKQLSDEHESLESKFAGKTNAVHFEVNLSVIKSDDCEKYIENALRKDAGVLGYHVDMFNKVVHLYMDKSKTTKKNIEQLIADAGFDANNIKANPEAFGKLPENCR